jgi:hypothetical protein
MQRSPFHDLDRLQHGVAGSWNSFDLASVNGNSVRCRVTSEAVSGFTKSIRDEMALTRFLYCQFKSKKFPNLIVRKYLRDP